MWWEFYPLENQVTSNWYIHTRWYPHGHIRARKYKKQSHILEFKINIFVYIMDKTHLDVQCGACVLHDLLRWRHNEHDGVSNHQPHDCLRNRWFRCRLRETSKFRVIDIVRWPVNSLHKWPVTRKMFPFGDVIMHWPEKWNILPNIVMWHSVNP